MTADFHDCLVELLPNLRAQARALTRDRVAAEDLVHDAVCNALAARASFEPGTNMAGWLYRILRNRFISDIRARRDTTPLDNVSAERLAVNGAHEHRIALGELDRALGTLPTDQRTALLMVTIDGLSYEELAKATGTAVGTAKSRVFRARQRLHTLLLGDGVEKRRGRRAEQTAGKDQPNAERDVPATSRNA